VVRLDGAVYPVKVRYGHWLPNRLGYAGTSIGLTIFLRQPWDQWLHPELLGHELVHTLHFVRIRENTPLRLYWLAVAIDLSLYFLDWVRSGFRYREMAEEVRAYGQQAEVAAGTHPDIRILPPGAA
jgi:hypothetical protein